MQSTLPTTSLDRIPSVRDLVEPEAAVARLSAACQRLTRLSQSWEGGATDRYHRTLAIVHDICAGIASAEAAGVPRDDIRRVVAHARDLHRASPFVTRLQTWPRGYPGDFETIEWLCRADNRAQAGTLAHVIESYALTAAISQQHRNKVTSQATRLLQVFATRRRCRVLSLGCGSNPDLRTVADHVPAEAAFVLCDSDADALDYTACKLGALAGRCRFVQGLVPRVLRRVRADGPFDLILAGGLFDYLPDRFITTTLREAWTVLAPGGQLFFTNIAAGNPFRVWIEYMGDWRLIERSEAEIDGLCRDAGVPVPTLQRDPTGLAILATVRRDL